MLRTFNNGIGMILIVSKEIEQSVLKRLNGLGEKSYSIGKVIERSSLSEERVNFV